MQGQYKAMFFMGGISGRGVNPPIFLAPPFQKVFKIIRMSFHPPGALWFDISKMYQKWHIAWLAIWIAWLPNLEFYCQAQANTFLVIST